MLLMKSLLLLGAHTLREILPSLASVLSLSVISATVGIEASPAEDAVEAVEAVLSVPPAEEPPAVLLVPPLLPLPPQPANAPTHIRDARSNAVVFFALLAILKSFSLKNFCLF